MLNNLEVDNIKIIIKENNYHKRILEINQIVIDKKYKLLIRYRQANLNIAKFGEMKSYVNFKTQYTGCVTVGFH